MRKWRAKELEFWRPFGKQTGWGCLTWVLFAPTHGPPLSSPRHPSRPPEHSVASPRDAACGGQQLCGMPQRAWAVKHDCPRRVGGDSQPPPPLPRPPTQYVASVRLPGVMIYSACTNKMHVYDCGYYGVVVTEHRSLTYFDNAKRCARSTGAFARVLPCARTDTCCATNRPQTC